MHYVYQFYKSLMYLIQNCRVVQYTYCSHGCTTTVTLSAESTIIKKSTNSKQCTHKSLTCHQVCPSPRYNGQQNDTEFIDLGIMWQMVKAVEASTQAEDTRVCTSCKTQQSLSTLKELHLKLELKTKKHDKFVFCQFSFLFSH